MCNAKEWWLAEIRINMWLGGTKRKSRVRIEICFCGKMSIKHLNLNQPKMLQIHDKFFKLFKDVLLGL